MHEWLISCKPRYKATIDELNIRIYSKAICFKTSKMILDEAKVQSELKIKAVAMIIKELEISLSTNKNVNLNELKSRACKKFELKTMPKLTDIISAVPKNLKKQLIPRLRVKPCRTASGIAVIAVMCKPHRCPHIYYTGNICVYCPGGPDSDFEYSTQAYTGYEPTSMRAISARYDPYLQVTSRIEQLQGLGHDVDKIEFILMGGTFMSLDKSYRDWFITGLHDALSGNTSKTLDEAIYFSEKSFNHRCIGLTIETRPDYNQDKHLKEMLCYGCTRIEIGIQSIYEDVALDTNRGHTISAACDSMRMSKDHGFKVTAHLMPDLPNVGLERDIYQFYEFFANPAFRSDGLKIYPTLVIRGTGLYELWKTKRYQNYTSAVLIDLICQLMYIVPPWVRVYRVQRDIPMPLISSSGVVFGHIRDMVMDRMRFLGLSCRDVRTREVGIKEIHEKVKPDQVELIRRDYYANCGWETFLSYEDPAQDILIGLLRLRKCEKHPISGISNWSIVRELHVYGTAVAISERDDSKFQHQGYGTLLMAEAERIAVEEHNSYQIGVISGVGTRNYYKKLGYHLEGSYMVKELV